MLVVGSSLATRKVWEKQRMAAGTTILGAEICVATPSIWALVAGARDAETAALNAARLMEFL